MGTDCSVIVDGQLHSLGRWYVFARRFESGLPVFRDDALQRIADLGATLHDAPSLLDHHQWWLSQARTLVESAASPAVTLVHEHDYERCFYSPLLRRECVRLGIAPGATWEHVARQLLDPVWGGFSVEIRGGSDAFELDFSAQDARFGWVSASLEVRRGVVRVMTVRGEA